MIVAYACLAFIIGVGAAALMAVAVVARLRAALRAAEAAQQALQAALLDAQAQAAVGQLAGGAAHDFNNHLTVISSNIELAAQRLAPVDERGRGHLTAALQGVRRAAALNAHVLTLARRPKPEPEAIDLNQRLESIVELLRTAFGHRVSVTVTLPGEPCFIWADTQHLETALLSVAEAVQRRIPLGATMHLAAGRGDGPESVNIVCGDAVDGKIPLASWSRDPSPGSWAGIDFGLPVTFVRQAGGSMQWAEHAVQWLLPRYVPPVPTRLGPRPNRKTTTILVVEDDAPLRAACVSTLRDLGYRVLEAPDAMEAYRLIVDRGDIDLLFADIGLPGGVSGRMLADAARHADPDLRILLTTGDRVPVGGATSILPKPFDTDLLVRAIRATLHGTVETASAER